VACGKGTGVGEGVADGVGGAAWDTASGAETAAGAGDWIKKKATKPHRLARINRARAERMANRIFCGLVTIDATTRNYIYIIGENGRNG
jgi:hypothetical protein